MYKFALPVIETGIDDIGINVSWYNLISKLMMVKLATSFSIQN